MRFRRHVTATVLATAIALIGVTGAAPAGAAEPGVTSDLGWSISDADKQKSAAALQDLGSRWTRLDIQWKLLETQNNTYNTTRLADFEKAIDVARAAGQQVVVTVYDAPAWASGSSSSNVPQNPQTFADFMSYLATRFKGKVAAYEVWNEQNLQRFWSTGVSASQYTQLLQATYPAIKAADPAAKVLFGGLSQNDYEYVEAAYAAGAKGYFDVMAVHPYTDCQTGTPRDAAYTSGGRMTKQSYLAYREVRASMVAQGDAKPIWFTEFGWSTASTQCNPGAGVWQGGVSQQKQADFTYDAFKLVEQDPYVEVAMVYSLRNSYWEHDADNVEAQFGLMRTDYSHKLAYDAFRAYARGLSYSYYEQPGSTPPPPTGGGSTSTDPVPTSTTVKVKRGGSKKTRSAPSDSAPVSRVVRGQVSPASGGDVEVTVQRRVGGKWRSIRARSIPVAASGKFSYALRSLPAGSLRVYAEYGGSDGHQPSRSSYVRFSAN